MAVCDVLFEENQALAHRYAKEWFAGHQLTRELLVANRFQSFLCKRPDSNVYAFRVIVQPHGIFLSGDLNVMAITYCSSDPLGWLQECYGKDGSYAWSYLLEKIDWELRDLDFYSKEGRRYILERRREGSLSPDQARVLYDFLEYPDVTPESWGNCYYRTTGDGDLPNLRYPSFQMCAQWEALGWLIQKLREERS